MTLFVSVISHGHDRLIESNEELVRLAKHPGVEVVVRDNLNSKSLGGYVLNHGMHYNQTDNPLGFGGNNNAVFDICREQLGMSSEDYFCLLNPDLLVKPDLLLGLVAQCTEQSIPLATINLYQDSGLCCYDLNIKRFPSLLDFAKGFLLGSNPAAYDKDAISEACTVDWASGAFLLFRADLYEALCGFDERFFMYLEDVDICRRAKELMGESLWYFPQLKAVHLCQQANKRLFSKHFWWFLSSMFRYFWKWRLRTRPRLR